MTGSFISVASVTLPGSVIVDPISVKPVADKGWSPFFQGTVTIPRQSATVEAALDPRVYPLVYLELWATDLVTGAVTSLMAARGLVRSRKRDYVNDTVTLTLASAEAKLDDYALADAGDYAPGTINADVLVNNVLAKLGESPTVSSVLTGNIVDPASKWVRGDTARKFLQPILDAKNAVLYCNLVGGQWIVRDKATSPFAGTATITYGDNLVTADDEVDMDRGDWADAAVVSYRWVDAAGVSRLKFYSTSIVIPYHRTFVQAFNTPDPGFDSSSGFVNRANASGVILTVTCLADRQILPGFTVTVVLPGGTYTATVRACAWDYPADTITLTLENVVKV